MSRLAKVSTTIVLCLMLFAGVGAAAQLNAYISDLALYVNGQKVNESVIVVNSTTYLPVRAIGNAIGAQVAYDAEAKRIDVNTAAVLPGQPEQPSVTTKTYGPGMYKVGTDMPAGEYVLTGGSGSYFQVATDSSGQLSSIVSNALFKNRTILTVKDGQYLTMRDCTAYPFDSAPRAQLTNGCLPEGMYKVGVDLQAGEYKVIPDGMGYVEVSTNSNHTLTSIVSNDIFEQDRYITVTDGQYIKVSGAKIKIE